MFIPVEHNIQNDAFDRGTDMPKSIYLKVAWSSQAAVFATIMLLHTLYWTPVCRADAHAQPANKDQYIGEVSELEGTVTLRRRFRSIPIGIGTRIRIKDTLKTGSNGAIGIVFNDHTIMSLGPDSKLKIQEYMFNPRQSEFSFVVKLLKGTASYVSGLIAKISPESAKFITPTASIGIRGTKMVIQVN